MEYPNSISGDSLFLIWRQARYFLCSIWLFFPSSAFKGARDDFELLNRIYFSVPHVRTPELMYVESAHRPHRDNLRIQLYLALGDGSAHYSTVLLPWVTRRFAPKPFFPKPFLLNSFRLYSCPWSFHPHTLVVSPSNTVSLLVVSHQPHSHYSFFGNQ